MAAECQKQCSQKRHVCGTAGMESGRMFIFIARDHQPYPSSHPVFQMGKTTSQEAPLCGKTSKAWKPFTYGSSKYQQCHFHILFSRHPDGNPGPSSPPLHACFWVHEVVKVLRVLHTWGITLSYIPSYTLFTCQLWGCSMQTSIAVGKQ